MSNVLLWLAVASALSCAFVLLAGLWTGYRRGRRETAELGRLGDELRNLTRAFSQVEWDRGSGGVGGIGGGGGGGGGGSSGGSGGSGGSGSGGGGGVHQ